MLLLLLLQHSAKMLILSGLSRYVSKITGLVAGRLTALRILISLTTPCALLAIDSAIAPAAVWAAEAFGLGWATSMVAATPFFSAYVSETLFSLFFI